MGILIYMPSWMQVLHRAGRLLHGNFSAFLWDFQAYALQQLKVKTDSEYLESAFSTDLTDEY